MKYTLRKKQHVCHMLWVVSLFLFVTTSHQLYAHTDNHGQKTMGLEDTFISIRLRNGSLEQVFRTIEKKTSFVFAYGEDIKRVNTNFDFNYSRTSVRHVLKTISDKTKLNFKRINNTISVTFAETQRPIQEVQQPIAITIRGVVEDNETQSPLPGVNVLLKNSSNGTITDIDGNYSITANNPLDTLVFSYIGYAPQEIPINNRETIDVSLATDVQSLSEVVVTGYSVQKRESLTGAISAVDTEDLGRVSAVTTSGLLAGKLPGVSFRMPDGRPGAGANIQIRNMGNPLFIIDGIQKDAGQFNNLSPNDIESISILKDASAAIYGSRAANGVVIVTTKKGTTGQEATINIDTYYGVQNWVRFPETVNAFEWMNGKADSEVNQNGSTPITADELSNWQAGTEQGYQSFDWYDFIIQPNAPQYSANINASGGTKNVNYYISATKLHQNSVLGREFTFDRSNIQANVDAKVADALKVGIQVNGRIETRDNPGVPGVDDYWAPRFALFRNRPTERPYANDNPNYPADIGHNAENWAILNKKISGYWTEDWRVLQTNLSAEYQFPVEGLSARGMYSYYFADRYMNGHEYTYDVYTFYPDDDEYRITGGSSNPWRERGQDKVLESVMQAQLNYNRTFGRHTIGAFLLSERIQRDEIGSWVHAVPKTNVLPIIQFEDMDTYNDYRREQARVGYVGKLNYAFDDRYYVELSGRRDASWKFAPGKRWGTFPAVSAGWRISEESFYQSTGLNDVLSDIKIRGSYGKLGDDNLGDALGPFDYIVGYTYPAGTVILDGQPLNTSTQNRAVPVENISWFTSIIADVGIDFELWNGKLTGSVDYFRRNRSGLLGNKYDVLIPAELGYSLPQENVNKDAVVGGETGLNYQGNIGQVTYSVGANFSYARKRFIASYKPRFGSSYEHYRNSGEDRWANIFWGYEVIGQFESMEQIAAYEVDIDGQGNKTMLPGDLIYKDVDGDGTIGYYDQRPIGYATGEPPTVNYGMNISISYKGFNLVADFSGASMYTLNRNWEMRWPYQNTGNLLASMYDDRWHRADVLDPNSEWIPGENPPLRFNYSSHSNYNRDSNWWATNQTYLRLRTAEIGYSLPQRWIEPIKMQQARVFINTYNLFSIDNVKKFGIDPEIVDSNGLQYPQNKLINVGVNITF